MKSSTSAGFIRFAGPDDSFQNDSPPCFPFASFGAACSEIESGVSPCAFSAAKAPRLSAASIAPDTFAFCAFSAT